MKYFQSSLLEKGFPGGSDDKASFCSAADPGLIPGSVRSPGEGSGNAFSGILAWRIPWTEEHMLQSVGLQRVGHD